MPAPADSPEMNYANLPKFSIFQLCDANYSALKHIFITAPSEVREQYPSLPRRARKMLAIILSLREYILLKVGQDADKKFDPQEDKAQLERMLRMSFEEVECMAQENLVGTAAMVKAALRADDTLQPRTFRETDHTSVIRLILKWQLEATKAELQRRNLDDTVFIQIGLMVKLVSWIRPCTKIPKTFVFQTA